MFHAYHNQGGRPQHIMNISSVEHNVNVSTLPGLFISLGCLLMIIPGNMIAMPIHAKSDELGERNARNRKLKGIQKYRI